MVASSSTRKDNQHVMEFGDLSMSVQEFATKMKAAVEQVKARKGSES